MKHIFIVNPMAGKTDAGGEIARQLRALPDVDAEVYTTRAPHDATEFARSYAQSHADEQVRFYACGGDGTIGEVANGIVGLANASMSCYPCGSGTDFVKYYGGKDRFLNVDRLIRGTEQAVDLMRVNDRWCINAFNFGFDSVVCETMIRVKRKPLIGGKNAYTTGVIWALLHAMRTKCRITADGEVLPIEEILLCTVANGSHVGGSFYCAPRSADDDGLAEVCAVRPVSRVRFVTLAGAYQRGEHLDLPSFRDIVVYRRAKNIAVDFAEETACVLDGEMLYAKHFDVAVQKHAIRFAIPAEDEKAAPKQENNRFCRGTAAE